MNKISIYNYESFVIDYLDRNLDESTIVELEIFIMNHPELNISLDDFPILEKEAANNINKHSLYKSIDDLVSEDQLILYIENQLPENERLHILESCNKNSSLKRELTLFELTKLNTDNTIIFPHTQILKKGGLVILFTEYQQVYRIAASVLFLIGLFILTKTIVIKENATYYSERNKTINYPPSNKSPNARIDSVIVNTSAKSTLTIPKQYQAINTNLPENKIQITETESVSNSQTNIQNTNTDSIPENKIDIEQLHLLAQNNQANHPRKIILLNEENENNITIKNSAKKKGFWAIARNTLEKLNRYGVKSVDGNEANMNNNTSYELTLGPLNIQHKTSH
jgi:hypothetical protein